MGMGMCWDVGKNCLDERGGERIIYLTKRIRLFVHRDGVAREFQGDVKFHAWRVTVAICYGRSRLSVDVILV